MGESTRRRPRGLAEAAGDRAVVRPSTQELRRPASPPPPTRDPSIPTYDESDWMLLAQMDPAELAAAMSGVGRSKRASVGDRIEGVITRLGGEQHLVDVGDKMEGLIDASEVPDAKVGQAVTAFVLARDEGGLRLSARLSDRNAAGFLEEAKASRVPVEGKVTARNAGGFEVRIGPVRAFCPASQISRMTDTDADALVGQTLSFLVTEAGDRVILNRRALQEGESQARAATFWQSVREGDLVGGVVRRVQPFGAFVDVGGVDGLLPRRAAGWADDALDRLRPGTQLEVRIERIDRDAKRIELSARPPADDPWNEVGVRWRAGMIVDAKVARMETFGAFVDLAPGITGLVHASRLAGLSPRAGEALVVRIASIDTERRRIELTPVRPGSDATPTSVQGTIAQVLQNGVVVTLDDGRVGWIPAAEVDLPAGTVLAQRFRPGRRVTARPSGERGGRVNLSLREEVEDVAPPPPPPSGTGFGTFADLLRKR